MISGPDFKDPFTTILQKGAEQGIVPNKTMEARTWYRNLAGKFKDIKPEQMLDGTKTTLTHLMHPGRMYMFMYDAKHKKTLPYWDRFPLIFPIERYHDGFLGINMHYLHPVLRATLMDALYTYVSNTKFDDSTKLNISYNILKDASRARYFKPCIKKYLNGHFRTQFLYIAPSEWDISLFLPLERFQKADKTKVWEDSRRAVNAI